MGLVLQLVETRADGGTRSVELMELGRPGNLRDIADLGLTLPEAKQLLACVQQAVVAIQARDHARLRPDRASCGERFRIKDWRSRRVATLFGAVVVRLPRLRCPGCGRGETGTNGTIRNFVRGGAVEPIRPWLRRSARRTGRRTVTWPWPTRAVA